MKAAFDLAGKALAFLEFHQLQPSVAHYALALDIVTRPGSALAKAVEAHTDGGLRLGADTIAELGRAHLAAPDGAAVDRREQTVARQTAALGSLTSDAQDLTHALSRDVGTMARAADDWPQADGLVARLSDAERDLADLRHEFARLRADVAAGAPPPRDDDRDDLTQALNQQSARPLLEGYAAGGRSYVTMLFSVDDLIGINERFGRGVGDNVLNAFAATLRQVFPDEELIRWSGNEFIIVVGDLTLGAARERAEDALTAFHARRLKLRGTGEWIGIVTASAGVALAQGGTHEEVLDRVRNHVQSATARGQGQVGG